MIALPQSLAESMLRVMARFRDAGLITSTDRQSYLALLARAVGAAQWTLWQRVDRLVSDLIPSTATGAALEAWAACFGLSRQRASTATGGIVVTAEDPYHTDTITIPEGTEWIGPLGVSYLSTAEAEIAPGEATGAVTVTAAEPGGSANLPPGATLALVSSLPGILTSATVSGDGITGGADEESDESLRTHVLDAIRWPRGIGNVAHVEAIARAADPSIRAVSVISAHGRAFIYLDTMNGYNRVVSAAAWIKAMDAINAAVPAGITAYVSVISPQSIPVSIRGISDATTRRTLSDAIAAYLGSVPRNGTVERAGLLYAIRGIAYSADLVDPAGDTECITTAPQLPPGGVTWL